MTGRERTLIMCAFHSARARVLDRFMLLEDTLVCATNCNARIFTDDELRELRCIQERLGAFNNSLPLNTEQTYYDLVKAGVKFSEYDSTMELPK